MRTRLRILCVGVYALSSVFSHLYRALWTDKLRCTMKKEKNPHAVALGKMGGLKGGKKRAARLTPEERSASARNAALARWARTNKSGEKKNE